MRQIYLIFFGLSRILQSFLTEVKVCLTSISSMWHVCLLLALNFDHAISPTKCLFWILVYLCIAWLHGGACLSWWMYGSINTLYATYNISPCAPFNWLWPIGGRRSTDDQQTGSLSSKTSIGMSEIFWVLNSFRDFHTSTLHDRSYCYWVLTICRAYTHWDLY